MLQRIERMKFALRSNIRGMGLIWAFKKPEVMFRPVNANSGLPFACARMPIGAKNTRLSARVGRFPVLHVFRFGCLSQICKRIVGSIRIDVVDLKRRPFSGHVEPRKPVSWINVSVDHYHSVAIAWASSRVSCFDAADAVLAPRKHASLRIVVEKFAQTLRGKIGLSHAVVPLKQWFGQRPASADNASGLRYFSVGGA